MRETIKPSQKTFGVGLDFLLFTAISTAWHANPASNIPALATLLVIETPALSLTALGGYFGRDITVLGRSARRLAAVEDARIGQKVSVARELLLKMTERQA